MHRIDFAYEPPALARYRESHPQMRDWNAFGSVLLSSLDPAVEDKTKTLKEHMSDVLAQNQSGLCAYCEMNLPIKGDRRIEHIHPKSDASTDHNWMLDWHNLLAVCHGGRSNNVWAVNETELHCDASKAADQTAILNPYLMPNACLFYLDRKTGELSPDEDVCRVVENRGTPTVSMRDIVRNTIRVLNLNCRRLCELRKTVIQSYKRRYQIEQKTAKGSVREIIAKDWFGNNRVMEFYTTRRCLLGIKADSYIATVRH